MMASNVARLTNCGTIPCCGAGGERPSAGFRQNDVCLLKVRGSEVVHVRLRPNLEAEGAKDFS